MSEYVLWTGRADTDFGKAEQICAVTETLIRYAMHDGRPRWGTAKLTVTDTDREGVYQVDLTVEMED